AAQEGFARQGAGQAVVVQGQVQRRDQVAAGGQDAGDQQRRHDQQQDAQPQGNHVPGMASGERLVFAHRQPAICDAQQHGKGGQQGDPGRRALAVGQGAVHQGGDGKCGGARPAQQETQGQAGGQRGDGQQQGAADHAPEQRGPGMAAIRTQSGTPGQQHDRRQEGAVAEQLAEEPVQGDGRPLRIGPQPGNEGQCYGGIGGGSRRA